MKFEQLSLSKRVTEAKAVRKSLKKGKYSLAISRKTDVNATFLHDYWVQQMYEVFMCLGRAVVAGQFMHCSSESPARTELSTQYIILHAFIQGKLSS
jgi:hypothetical protein